MTLFPTLTPVLCAELAREEFGGGIYQNKTTKALDEEITQSLIGTSYIVCSDLWNLIDPQNNENLNNNAEPKHLFWALLFLNTYCTEPILRRVVGCVDAGTFRDWSWAFIKEISSLKPRVVCLSLLVPLVHSIHQNTYPVHSSFSFLCFRLSLKIVSEIGMVKQYA